MSFLVSKNTSYEFFTTRLRFTHWGAVLGLMLSGIALHNKISIGPVTSVFTLIFLVAFVSRATSAFLLSQKKEEGRKWYTGHHQSFREILKHLSEVGQTKWILLFLFFFNMAIFISAPFVNPYLLKQMNFPYDQYMWILIALLLGKALGFFATKRENFRKMTPIKVLMFGALGICPWPVLWVFVKGLVGAILLQFVSGFFWAIFETGQSLVFFNSLTDDKKIPVLTIFNLLSTVAMVLGTGLGGIFILNNTDLSQYFYLFSAAVVVRLGVVGYFWKQLTKV